MKLSFDFDNVKTAVIYADDDPEYMIGCQHKQTYELTERQKQLKRLFMGIIYRVKQYDIPVNIDNLIESIRDYFQEKEEIA